MDATIIGSLFTFIVVLALQVVAPLKGLPTVPLHIDPKRGVADIPNLIEKKTEGLLFRLGQGNYYGPVIRDYLTQLTKQPFLKYVLEDKDTAFFAMADARGLAEVLTSANPPYSADDVANWINLADKTSLQKLPGFLSAEEAVTDETYKRRALQSMESRNVDTLPVVDKTKRFVGIVNRSRLTASLILDVAENLK